MNFYDFSSRLLSVTVSLLGIIFFSPLFVFLACLVRLSGPGPIFYRGKRLGKDKQIINIYKFRTMGVNAEQQIGGRQLQDTDSFVTPIGKFLRDLKLDELPQLFNILKGDMVLVGPRPLRPVFLPIFKAQIPDFEKRFQVLPGITGLAQYRGGYYTPWHHKSRYDLLYIKRQSLWLDVKILFGTLSILYLRVQRRLQGLPISERQIPVVFEQKKYKQKQKPAFSFEDFSRNLSRDFQRDK